MDAAARLAALRSLMQSDTYKLAAYIVPTADAHNSEYISAVDARREWLTGFTGSAGTAVVTSRQAPVWTDGRYYTQFEREADTSLYTLMRQTLPETPSMEKWLTANLSAGDAVGADPHTMTHDEWAPLQKALEKSRMSLRPVSANLIDVVRSSLGAPPPPRPRHALAPLSERYTGRAAGEKVREVRDKMADKKAAALVITALDEIAYLLNLRGSDIPFNPVFYSYLVLTPDCVCVYWAAGELPPDVKEHFAREGVTVDIRPYDGVESALGDMATQLSQLDGNNSVWVPGDASEAIYRAASGFGRLKDPLDVVTDVSPVALMKLIKNEVELQGFRRCHERDGIAVIRFFRWLHQNIHAGVTETQAADKLLEFRKDEEDFMGESFSTIPGAGANGAIIHYSPARTESHPIRADDMFLLDSGGQYRDGTTDITRTRHMGTPTAEQRDAFTRVLKGQMMLGAAVFPRGVKGNVLDSFARKFLWDVGLDYGHGTGHGVGHYLNVHEGPAGVSWRPYPHDPGLAPGQVLSNEPGYYKVGSFGIRHEDLVETIAVTRDTDHPRAAGMCGDFGGRGAVGFRTLTLVPHQAKCIDTNLLDDFELSYLNAYHARVLSVLGPQLAARGLQQDLEWLRGECRALARE